MTPVVWNRTQRDWRPTLVVMYTFKKQDAATQWCNYKIINLHVLSCSELAFRTKYLTASNLVPIKLSPSYSVACVNPYLYAHICRYNQWHTDFWEPQLKLQLKNVPLKEYVSPLFSWMGISLKPNLDQTASDLGTFMVGPCPKVGWNKYPHFDPP